MKHPLFFLCLLLCLIFNSTKIYAKNRKYVDQLTMEIEWKSDSTLYIKATLKHYKLPSDKDTFYFVMHPIYKIKNITADSYVTHGITRNAASSLPFPQLFIKVAADAKNERVFNFEYIIDLKKDNHIKSNWIELSLDKLWYPMMNGFESKFTSSVVIRNVPVGYTVYSHSNAQVKEIENGTFAFTNTNPSHEILLMAGLNMTDKVYSQSKYNIRITASTTTSDSLITAMFKK